MPLEEKAQSTEKKTHQRRTSLVHYIYESRRQEASSVLQTQDKLAALYVPGFSPSPSPQPSQRYCKSIPLLVKEVK